jgi:hypothetical protein
VQQQQILTHHQLLLLLLLFHIFGLTIVYLQKFTRIDQQIPTQQGSIVFVVVVSYCLVDRNISSMPPPPSTPRRQCALVVICQGCCPLPQYNIKILHSNNVVMVNMTRYNQCPQSRSSSDTPSTISVTSVQSLHAEVYNIV